MAFIRIKGDKARRYIDPETDEIISRRQYDEHYGRLAKAGIKSNEQQAKINAELLGEEQLARPARGRTKIKETDAKKRAEELKERVNRKKQKESFEALQNKVKKAKKKATRRPQISDRLLKAGKYSYRLNVPFEFEPIRDAVEEARGTQIERYGVGVNGYSEQTGESLSAWIQLEKLKVMRSINMDFTEGDFGVMVSWVEEHGYFIVTSAFVHFAWEREYAEAKAETALRKKRKQVFGNPIRGLGHGNKGSGRKASGN